jgi:hypothetical protein
VAALRFLHLHPLAAQERRRIESLEHHRSSKAEHSECSFVRPALDT